MHASGNGMAAVPDLARTPASASACRITSQACGLVGLYRGPPALSLSLPPAGSACATILLLGGCLLLPLCRWWVHAVCLRKKDEVLGEPCRVHERGWLRQLAPGWL